MRNALTRSPCSPTIRGCLAIMLSVLLVSPFSASNAQRVELQELSLCDTSIDQMGLPAFTAPASLISEKCKRCNAGAVRGKFTASIAGPSGSDPLLVLTTPFGWPNALELKNGASKEMSISCEADPMIAVAAKTAFARHVRESQATQPHGAAPSVVASLRTEWSVASSTACSATEVEEITTEYVVRSCPERRRFPVTAAGGVALLSRAVTTSSLPRHELLVDDRDSAQALEDVGEGEQLLLLSPNASMYMATAPSSIPHRLPAPVELDVAVWVLDDRTTRQQVEAELEETNQIYARALLGIKLRLASFTDSRDPSATGRNLQERLKCFCRSPPIDGNCRKESWPAIGCLQSSSCDSDGACRAPVYREIAYDENRINLYYAGSVFGVSLEGVACQKTREDRYDGCMAPSKPNNVVLLARNLPPFPGRLAHELGHVLGLGHPEGQGCGARRPDPELRFSENNAFPNNLMVIGTSVDGDQKRVGDFLTPAQVLTAYTSPASWLHQELEKRRRSEKPRFGTCWMPSPEEGCGSGIPLYTDRARAARADMQGPTLPIGSNEAETGSRRTRTNYLKGALVMDASQALVLVTLGILLGLAGQGLRAVVGIKKELDDAKEAKQANPNLPVPNWFNGKELGFSLLIGGLAGGLAAVLQYGPDIDISKELLFGFVGAGYAGADFITGVTQKWIKT